MDKQLRKKTRYYHEDLTDMRIEMEAREWVTQIDERRDVGPYLPFELIQTGRPSCLKGIPAHALSWPGVYRHGTGGSRHHGSSKIPGQPLLDKPIFLLPLIDLYHAHRAHCRPSASPA